ncbi:MAG: hypothetical protein Q4F49_01340 [Pseudoxanthomonas suwonensis]|nr:hypothetical protein [Pseudoxanthomonas suwonensis]
MMGVLPSVGTTWFPQARDRTQTFFGALLTLCLRVAEVTGIRATA